LVWSWSSSTHPFTYHIRFNVLEDPKIFWGRFLEQALKHLVK
jgi:hypothetical protein